jgi:hypothetical protein
MMFSTKTLVLKPKEIGMTVFSGYRTFFMLWAIFSGVRLIQYRN